MPAYRFSLRRTAQPHARSSPRPHTRGGRPQARKLTGWFNRNRRLAVALLLCLAAGIAVHQLTPSPATTVTSLASARDLPAGTALTGADVVSVSVPQAMLTGGAITDTGTVTGRQLAVPLRKGQLLSDTQLLGPGLLAGMPTGSAAVPLRMADASSIQLISPGQLVNVVITKGSGYDQQSASEVLAQGVPVLWTSSQGGKTGQWLGTDEADGLLVVAANTEQAGKLAGASTQGKLFFVLVGPAVAE